MTDTPRARANQPTPREPTKPDITAAEWAHELTRVHSDLWRPAHPDLHTEPRRYALSPMLNKRLRNARDAVLSRTHSALARECLELSATSARFYAFQCSAVFARCCFTGAPCGNDVGAQVCFCSVGEGNAIERTLFYAMTSGCMVLVNAFYTLGHAAEFASQQVRAWCRAADEFDDSYGETMHSLQRTMEPLRRTLNDVLRVLRAIVDYDTLSCAPAASMNR
jgi:hypothetical protein